MLTSLSVVPSGAQGRPDRLEDSPLARVPQQPSRPPPEQQWLAAQAHPRENPGQWVSGPDLGAGGNILHRLQKWQ